jgi:hypothetical protein
VQLLVCLSLSEAIGQLQVSLLDVGWELKSCLGLIGDGEYVVETEWKEYPNLLFAWVKSTAHPCRIKVASEYMYLYIYMPCQGQVEFKTKACMQSGSNQILTPSLTNIQFPTVKNMNQVACTSCTLRCRFR